MAINLALLMIHNMTAFPLSTLRTLSAFCISSEEPENVSTGGRRPGSWLENNLKGRSMLHEGHALEQLLNPGPYGPGKVAVLTRETRWPATDYQ